MGRFVRGEVVVVRFPFSDLSNTKRRPAVIVSPLKRDDAVICPITSRDNGDGYSIEIQASDFKNGRLPVNPSYVRPNRVFTVDTNIIENTIGSLTASKIKEIIDSLVNIIS